MGLKRRAIATDCTLIPGQGIARSLLSRLSERVTACGLYSIGDRG